jgi:protein-arginine kinase activator protein McsA
MEDDYRGCTPFVLERQNQCETRLISGLNHVNCKSTCEEDSCNTERVVKTLQCHSCSASFDSFANLNGVGDGNCLENAELVKKHL